MQQTLAVDLEGTRDTRPSPVFRGEVLRRQHRKAAIAADEAEVGLLVAHQAEEVSIEADQTATNGLFPEERMPEDDHHGPVGGGSQPDGRIAATLLQSVVDEEPWVRTLRLDEGVGMAATWLHVH